MFNRLFRSLTTADAVTRTARSSDYRRFAHLFSSSDIAFLSVPNGFEKGLDPNVSQEELLAQIRGAANDLSNRESFQPFRYKKEGRVIFPLFTKTEFGQEFVGSYSGEVRRLIPFQLLVVSGRLIAGCISSEEAVILNDRTSEAVELSYEQLSQLRALY